MSNDDHTHVDAAHVELILQRAVELAGEDANVADERVPLSELERAAAEVGVPAEAVARAAREQKTRRTTVRVTRLVGTLSLAFFGVFSVLVASPSDQTPPVPVTSSDEPKVAHDLPRQRPQASREGTPPPMVAPPTSQEHEQPLRERLVPHKAEERESAPPALPLAHLEADDAPETAIHLSPLSGEAVAQAQKGVTGTWRLVAWVGAKGQPLEVPASARSTTEPAAEMWHFLAGGRFRRTIGDDFAVSGRWSIMSKAPTPEGVQWLGVDTWWLVALDQVQVLAMPGQARAREWALIGKDGEERIIFHLGTQPRLDPHTFGARSVRGAPEAFRR